MTRGTRDVDVVVLADGSTATAVVDALATDETLYLLVGEARAATHGGSFNVLHPATGGKVDVFIVPGDDAFTRSRIARRARAEVLGVPCWVASPEDVVLAKLRWRLESRSEVQWRDCAEIAATQPLDRSYLADLLAAIDEG